MAQTVLVDNFTSLNIIRATQVDADLTAGSNVVSAVIDSQNYAVGDFVAVGTLGSSTCEITTITAVGGPTSVTLATLTLNHQRSEPLTKLFGSQVKLYSAADVNGNPPPDTSFAVVGSATNIVPNSQQTSLTDPSGSVGYWYKFIYYNSATSTGTALSDSKVIRGGGYGDYATLDEIRAEAGMSDNPNIGEAVVARMRTRAQNIINGFLYEVYTTPFTVPVPDLINTSTILLAAGYLLMQEYGTSTTNLKQDGQSKINQVIATDEKKMAGELGILDMIKIREMILTDDAGNSLLLSDITSSYPNNSTDPTLTVSDPNTIGSARYFNMNERY